MLLRPNLCIKSSLSTPDVRLRRINKVRPLKDTPEPVQGEENGDTDVGSEEIGGVEGSLREHLPSIEENDDGEVDECEPGCVWLPR